MATHPFPVDLVRIGRVDHVVPKVCIADGLLAGIDPTLALPAGDPLRHPIDHIAAIGIERHFARLDQSFQSLDDSSHFHAIVGGGRFGPRHFLFMLAHAQQRAPTAWAGVPFACAVSKNFYFFQLARTINSSRFKDTSIRWI